MQNSSRSFLAEIQGGISGTQPLPHGGRAPTLQSVPPPTSYRGSCLQMLCSQKVQPPAATTQPSLGAEHPPSHLLQGTLTSLALWLGGWSAERAGGEGTGTWPPGRCTLPTTLDGKQTAQASSRKPPGTPRTLGNQESKAAPTQHPRARPALTRAAARWAERAPAQLGGRGVLPQAAPASLSPHTHPPSLSLPPCEVELQQPSSWSHSPLPGAAPLRALPPLCPQGPSAKGPGRATSGCHIPGPQDNPTDPSG